MSARKLMMMHGLARVTCKRAASRAATRSSSYAIMRSHPFSSSAYGESITYSGGQASEGQGGFYGSGGARVSKIETEHKPEMMALASDVENLTLVMQEIYKLEEVLEEEKEGNSGVTGKSLEIGSKIKKIMTSSDVMDCLNRLEVEGEPVWGLSSEERDLVHAARQKVNEC